MHNFVITLPKCLAPAYTNMQVSALPPSLDVPMDGVSLPTYGATEL